MFKWEALVSPSPMPCAWLAHSNHFSDVSFLWALRKWEDVASPTLGGDGIDSVLWQREVRDSDSRYSIHNHESLWFGSPLGLICSFFAYFISGSWCHMALVSSERWGIHVWCRNFHGIERCPGVARSGVFSVFDGKAHTHWLLFSQQWFRITVDSLRKLKMPTAQPGTASDICSASVPPRGDIKWRLWHCYSHTGENEKPKQA